MYWVLALAFSILLLGFVLLYRAGHAGAQRPEKEMTPAVAAEDVWKYYGDYPALREIELAVEPGSCVALLGRNGAGKTTLLRIIAGFSKAGKGRVSIFGKDARDPETRRRVGVLGPRHLGL